MMSFLRHFNIFKRACPVEGKEWEEKHDPKILVDCEVGLSCLLFLVVSAALYSVGNMYGCVLFLTVTTFSLLADAVFVNHYYIDLTDRIFATIGGLYMVWFTTRWFVEHQDWTQYLVWVKILAQLISILTPLTYFDRCRAFAVRSKKWKESHIMWHITGAWGILVSIYVSHGYLDELFRSVGDLSSAYFRSFIDASPIVWFLCNSLQLSIDSLGEWIETIQLLQNP